MTEAKSDTTAPRPARRNKNTLTALIAAGVVVGMVGMAFAAVPLYELFCQVTGFGGTTQRADFAPDEVLDREVIVQFDSNTNPSLAWEFKPAQRRVRVNVGEPAEIYYVATNLSDTPTTGTATFNVTPETVGGYFMKIQCFCFTEQTLEPGESVEMPVLFYVDPSIADDPNLDYVDTITLSYTFYPVSGAQQPSPVAQNAVGGDG